MREIKFKLWNVKKKKFYGPYSIYKINYGDSDPDEWIPMQFTGLHDKNGKEIYYADVMLWPDGYKQITGFNEKHTEISVRDIETSFGYHFDSQHPVDKGKVIGNRFENPELMEDK